MVEKVAGEEVEKAYCLGHWDITGPTVAIEQNELAMLTQEGRSIIWWDGTYLNKYMQP